MKRNTDLGEGCEIGKGESPFFPHSPIFSFA